MKLLTVYDDECPHNPIVYVGRIREDIDLADAICEQVQFAIVDAGIKTEKRDIMNIVYDTVGVENFTWLNERYLFSIKEI